MKWLIAYGVCPALACGVLWLRQGRFLAPGIQIPGAIMLGPVSLLVVLLAPRSMLTSREGQGGGAHK
jgi:hypothetical protein